MRPVVLLLVVVCAATSCLAFDADEFEDEFEDEFVEDVVEVFEPEPELIPEPETAKEVKEEVEPPTAPPKPKMKQRIDDVPDEYEFAHARNDLEHLNDEEEFENFQPVPPQTQPKKSAEENDAPKLHVKRGRNLAQGPWDWRDYQLEALALFGMLAYAINYLWGRHKNSKIARTWLISNEELLNENFALVGLKDGTQLISESAHEKVLYGTGRRNCRSFTATLDLIKRHDLMSMFTDRVNLSHDRFSITIEMQPNSMGPLVFAVMQKTAEKRFRGESDDLKFFPKTYNGEKWGLPSNLIVLTDSMFVADSILVEEVVKLLTEHKETLELMHFTDQYAGRKVLDVPEDEAAALGPVDCRKMLFMQFLIPPANLAELKQEHRLMKLGIHFIDAVTKIDLPLQAKNKAEKSRAAFSEAIMKTSHKLREAEAQKRKEEKKKQEKAKYEQLGGAALEKFEDREFKKNLKRKTPKMKMMKAG
eukprot:m.14941 g.14941  ORF g.14941 m.14941 type:complete len:476 (-) comp9422_c0_seq1:67-1494(-)